MQVKRIMQLTWDSPGSYIHRLNEASLRNLSPSSTAKQEQFHSNRRRTTAGRPCPGGGRKSRGKRRGIKSCRAAFPSPTGIKDSPGMPSERAPRSSSPVKYPVVTSNRWKGFELTETWEPPVTILILSVSRRPTVSFSLALSLLAARCSSSRKGWPKILKTSHEIFRF